MPLTATIGLALAISAGGDPGPGAGPLPGPLHWYAAEGDATDSAGAQHGVVSGVVGYTPGPVGMAFDFSGGGGVRMPATVANFGAGDFTLAFWVRGELGGQRQIMSKRTACQCEFFFDIRAIATASMEMYASCAPLTGAPIALGGQPIIDGDWHHVAFVREGTSRRGYVDGVVRSRVDSGLVPVVNTAAQLWLNGGPCVGSDGTTLLNGAIDEVRIYDRAVSIQEIRDLAGVCTGDLDGDGFIGFADLNIALGAFNTAAGSPGYNPTADLDGDGDVDFGDLNVVLGAFNTAC